MECMFVKYLPSNLLVAEAIRPRSDHASLSEQFNWHKSTRVVRTHGTQDNKRLALGDARQAQLVVHAN